ncbi:MAG: helix-turn-helix domain-containing protein [Rhodoblastus sp.]|jgi:translation initiation factor IF-1
MVDFVEGEAFATVSNHVRALVRWHFLIELDDDERRLARLIAHMGEANRVGDKDEAIVQMTQEELSRLGFGARHRARRGLKSLQDQGLIELQYGQIFIPSVARLREYGFDGSILPLP